LARPFNTESKILGHSPQPTDQAGAVAALFVEAFRLHGAGQLNKAEALYRQVIAAQPRHFESLHFYGILQAQLGNNTEAARLIDAALQINPTSPEAHRNLGSALKALDRLDEALVSNDRAIALKPDYADAFYSRGVILRMLKRPVEALASFDRAVACKPDFPEAWSSRGNVLSDLRRFDEALATYDRALALKSDSASTFMSRGNALTQLKRLDEAMASFDRAITLKPDYVAAFMNRGNALYELKRFDEAVASYKHVLALKPDYAEAWSNLGETLTQFNRHEEALSAYDRAVTLAQNLKYAPGGRLRAKMILCDWMGFDEDCAQVVSAIRKGNLATPPFVFLSVSDTPQDQLACARMYIADRFTPHREPLWRGAQYVHGRIRLAYLSADFREHPIATLTAGLFEHHDRSQFEVIGMSFAPDQDSVMRQRIKASFDRFIDVRDKDDRDLAAMVRELEIDIAIDLMGFTLEARTGVFARRPAPIQVNYLGYAGTMGANYIDYIIGDRTVIPLYDEHAYAEKVVRLPDSFLVSDDRRGVSNIVPSRAQAGLPETGFVFCAFGQYLKIAPGLFAVWMRLLQSVEGSYLWLSEGPVRAMENLRREALASGIAAERLIFAPRIARIEDHLARHARADLFLDTLPYNAHATASDALWSGLPVVTCIGSTFAGRVAASQLRAVGLPELVANSLDDYEALALQIARDRDRLAGLKVKLAQNRNSFPLFDTRRFTRHIECAYKTMWERCQRGEIPASFDVPPCDGTERDAL
jgi:protein O-GlcNAc transferase